MIFKNCKFEKSSFYLEYPTLVDRSQDYVYTMPNSKFISNSLYFKLVLKTNILWKWASPKYIFIISTSIHACYFKKEVKDFRSVKKVQDTDMHCILW